MDVEAVEVFGSHRRIHAALAAAFKVLDCGSNQVRRTVFRQRDRNRVNRRFPVARVFDVVAVPIQYAPDMILDNLFISRR